MVQWENYQCSGISVGQHCSALLSLPSPRGVAPRPTASRLNRPPFWGPSMVFTVAWETTKNSGFF